VIVAANIYIVHTIHCGGLGNIAFLTISLSLFLVLSHYIKYFVIPDIYNENNMYKNTYTALQATFYVIAQNI